MYGVYVYLVFWDCIWHQNYKIGKCNSTKSLADNFLVTTHKGTSVRDPFLPHSRKVLLLGYSTLHVSFFSHIIFEICRCGFGLRVPSCSLLSMTFTIFTYISAAGVESQHSVCVFVNKRLLVHNVLFCYFM